MEKRSYINDIKPALIKKGFKIVSPDEDYVYIKTKLIDKLDNLKGMTFQKNLGSLFDKTQRMIKLSDFIAESLNIQDKTDISRTATLAKCDLSTKLVFEFTELQGFIGQNYAELDGEKPQGLCDSAWESMQFFVKQLALGKGNFYDGWMKNPNSAMISCNDGFRPVSFLIETEE